VPARTPQHLISAIHAAVITILNDNGVKKRLDELGFIPGGNLPSDFAAYVRSEVETARDLVKNIPPY
jgi:tripartite-type tricarboxylate transporter receptor subunit TctC